MKRILAVAAFLAAPLFAATPVSLHVGVNECPAGEVAAFEAVTASNAAALKVSCVVTVRETTNAVAQTVERKVRYDFALTNWNGEAFVQTNVYDRFAWSDWEVDGTNHVCVAPSATNVVVTNTFTIGVPGRTFAVTNALFDASSASHYLMATNPSLKYLSGRGSLVVTGASADDKLTLFIK